MSERITVATGAKTYEIADTEGNVLGYFRFVPTDMGILDRYKEVENYFDNIAKSIDDQEDMDSAFPELVAGVKEKIDYLFHAPVSDSFFAITNPFTLLDDGQMFAEHIINVVGEVIEREMKTRSELQKKKIEKYTSKYKK